MRDSHFLEELHFHTIEPSLCVLFKWYSIFDGVIFLQSKSDIETFGFSDIIFALKLCKHNITRHSRI